MPAVSLQGLNRILSRWLGRNLRDAFKAWHGLLAHKQHAYGQAMSLFARKSGLVQQQMLRQWHDYVVDKKQLSVKLMRAMRKCVPRTATIAVMCQRADLDSQAYATLYVHFIVCQLGQPNRFRCAHLF